MAASDNTISFADTDCRVYIEDGGSNSIEINPRLGSIQWAITPPTQVEVMHRGKHQTTPVIRKTTGGSVSVTLRVAVGSFYGSTAATPFEALMGTGTGSGWTTTGAGDGTMRRIRVVSTNPSSGGATQTISFAYCTVDSINVDMGGEEGTTAFDVTLTDHEDAPTIT